MSQLMKLIENDEKELIKIVKGKIGLCSDLVGFIVGISCRF